MSDPLQRIKEKRRLMMVEGAAFCEVCRQPDQGLPCYTLRPHPCAVVKLAEALDEIMHELGVPQLGYPMPVANAYEVAKRTLEEVAGE